MEQNKGIDSIIYKILIQQALLQQYLIHINICCLFNDYYFSIAYNGLAILVLALFYHIMPLKWNKIQYLIEYVFLALLQIFSITIQFNMIYTAGSLLGLELITVIYKICKTSFSTDQQLGLFKMCISILKCFMSLQLMFLTLQFNHILPWSWFQIFVILWFILICGMIFQICLTFNLVYKTIKRLFFSTVEDRKKDEIKYFGGIWYTMQFQCCTMNPFLTLLNLCLTLGGFNYNILLLSACGGSFLFVLLICANIRNQVKLYYQQINNFLPTAPTIETEGFFNERIPKYLVRVSSTYFQQAEIKRFEILSTSPRKSNDGDQKCLICFENESGFVLMNCGHGGLCLKCSSNLYLKQKGCYLCRQPIQKILQIQKQDCNFVEVIGIFQED